MGQALCDNNIDAFVFTVGHPSGAIQEVTSTCDVRIVNADDDELMALVDEIPFYFPATIPAGMYRGTDEDVQTFGVGATFVSSADVDDDVVYTLVASVFDNLDVLSVRCIRPSPISTPRAWPRRVCPRRCIRAPSVISASRA